MCVNEAGSIRLMEEKDVEQVEELEKLQELIDKKRAELEGR
jgi:hypothetical protein